MLIKSFNTFTYQLEKPAPHESFTLFFLVKSFIYVYSFHISNPYI